MKKRTKAAVIIAISLIITGVIVFTATMFSLDFDFSKLDNSVYVTNTYEYTDGVKNIKADLDSTDIKVLPSEDDTLKVVCNEKEDAPHRVSVEGDTLIIENTEKEWYEYLSVVNIDRSEITLYIPEKFATAVIIYSNDYTGTAYTSVYNIDLETDTGDITVEDFNYLKSVTAETDTGDIYLYNSNISIIKAQADTGNINIRKVTSSVSLETETDTGHTTIEKCNLTDITAEASTGDITFREVNTLKIITAETSTGDITFEKSDAENIYAKASTGDITGSVLSIKTFKADSSIGKVTVPNTTGTGIFEAKTSTGDINLFYYTE